MRLGPGCRPGGAGRRGWPGGESWLRCGQFCMQGWSQGRFGFLEDFRKVVAGERCIPCLFDRACASATNGRSEVARRVSRRPDLPFIGLLERALVVLCSISQTEARFERFGGRNRRRALRLAMFAKQSRFAALRMRASARDVRRTIRCQCVRARRCPSSACAWQYVCVTSAFWLLARRFASSGGRGDNPRMSPRR